MGDDATPTDKVLGLLQPTPAPTMASGSNAAAHPSFQVRGTYLNGVESDYSNHDLVVQWLATGNATAWNVTVYNDAAFQYPISLLVPTTVCYAIIFVAGILGNVVTCIIIKKNKSMHTATNYYLFNLAISDLLLLISGMPLDIYNMWIPYKYPFSSAVCMLLGMVSETTANATVLTITSFTVERYIAICHPFRQHMMDLSRAIKFIFAIWVVSFCLAIPQFIQIGVVEEYGTFTCTIKNKLIEHTFEVSSFLFFVGPMIVICALYILIGIKLHKSKLLHGVNRKGCPDVNSSHKNNANTSSGQARVIRMLVAVVVAFFLCWFPFHAQRLMAVNSTEGFGASQWQFYVILNQCSGIMYFLSTCINPLLYNIMSHKFRDAFQTTIARQFYWGRRRRSHNTQHHNQLPDRHSYSAISRRGGGGGGGGEPKVLRTPANSRTPPLHNYGEKPLSLIEHSQPDEQPRRGSEDRTRENIGQIMEPSYHENGDLNAIHCDKVEPPIITIIHTASRDGSSPKIVASSKCSTEEAAGRKKRAALLSCFSQSKNSISFFKSLKKEKSAPLSCTASTQATRINIPRIRKLTSVDSANTISNSSLQEVDDEEFNSSDLVQYMSEINQCIKC